MLQDRTDAVLPGAPTTDVPLTDVTTDVPNTDVLDTDVAPRDRTGELEREVATLREGLETRQRIGFVTGVVAQRYGLQPDAAWELLATVSQQLNVKARRVAEVLLDAYCGRLASADVPLAARITGLLPPSPVCFPGPAGCRSLILAAEPPQDPSVDVDRLSASLRTLAGRDLRNTGLHDALDEIAHACVPIFGVTGCGIMLADDQNVSRYVASSDEAGRILEIAESQAGQGPCLQAYIDLTAVATDDVTEDRRWPLLVPAVTGHGVRAVLGVPVRLGGVPVGTIDVYRDAPHEWTDAERLGLLRYADVVGRTLAAVMEAEHAGELAGQLQYALDHRIVVERGVGYLMASLGVDALTAFNLLRSSARNGRRKIGDIATEVLLGRPLQE